MFDLLLFQTNILSNQSTSTLTLNMVNFDIKKLQLHKQNFTNKRCKYESLKFPIVMKRRIHQKWVIVRNKQNFLILILPTSTATSKMYCFNFFLLGFRLDKGVVSGVRAMIKGLVKPCHTGHFEDKDVLVDPLVIFKVGKL